MDQPSDRAGRFFARIIAHPYRVVGAFAVLTVLAAWQLPRVRMDTDLRAYLPHDETYLDDHRIRETYDVRDTLIAAIVREPTALDVPTLRYARAVAARIEELDGVHRVSSLFSEDNIENTSEGLEIAPFIEEVTEASVAALRRKIAGFPAIHGIFVSQDGTCIALIVEVQGDADRGRIYHEIERISEEEESPEGTQVYLAGMPVCEGVLGEYMMRDLAVMMPAVIVVVVLLLFAAYRSWLLIVVALVEVALVDIWVIGLMAFAGVRLHTVHGTMPVVLMALAVADEIHIFDDYFARRLRGAAARQSILQTMSALWKPVTLTSVTTAVAFLSFVSSSMRPFRSFGLFTAFGVISAMAYSLLVTPVALAWWPWRAGGRAQRSSVAGWLGAFGEWAYRRRRLLLVTAGIVGLVAVAGASRVYVQDSWMGNFDRDSRVRRAFEVVRTKLLGPMLLYVEIDTGVDGGIKEPRFLRRLIEAEDEVRKLPSVGGTLSVAKILRKVNREFTGRDAVPRKRGASAFFLMMLEGGSHDNLWRPPYRRCLVNAFCRTDDYISGQANFPIFQATMEEHLPGVVISYGGDYSLSYHWVRLLIANFIKAFAGSAVLVFLTVLLFSRSLRFSVLTIAPILLALLLNFGVMGLLGIPFGVATSMFSSIILGIGIDYAIHLQSKLDALGGAGPQAARMAFASAGKAILWDAVVVICGFAVLLLSRMPPTRTLGGMVALGMGASFAATYLLLPALWSPGRTRPPP